MVESVIHDGVISLSFEQTRVNPNRHVVDYRVMQADGRALPDWLERPSQDLLQGHPAINAQDLELNVTAIYSDGTYVTELVRIHTSTGVIEPIRQQHSTALPKLFGEQFQAPTTLTDDESKALAKALQGAR